MTRIPTAGFNFPAHKKVRTADTGYTFANVHILSKPVTISWRTKKAVAKFATAFFVVAGRTRPASVGLALLGWGWWWH